MRRFSFKIATLASLTLTALIAMTDLSAADCLQWDISGHWKIGQLNGFEVDFDLTENNSGAIGGGGQYLKKGGGWGNSFASPIFGSVSGSMDGNTFSFIVVWTDGAKGKYEGQVKADGVIFGKTSAVDDPGTLTAWNVIDPARKATCMTAESSPSSAPPTQHAGVPVPGGVRFDGPVVYDSGGQLRQLDWCRVWAAECGKAAADAFCAAAGYGSLGALDFVEHENAGADGPTWVIGSSKACTDVHCTGFKSITCKTVGLGKKKAQSPTNPGPAGPTATVNADVDVYAKSGGDDADKLGGFLPKGSKVAILPSQPACDTDHWCHIQGNAVPSGSGWVWGSFLDF
jgi:hypothetical protein